MLCHPAAQSHQPNSPRRRRWITLVVVLAIWGSSLAGIGAQANPISSLLPGRFQNAPPQSIAPSPPNQYPTAATQLPSLEPIYWQQPLFFIPYQVNSQDSAVKQIAKVQLLISQTGANDWVLLQEAEPGVRGFSYHAPGDGQYWFGLRHLDRRGQPIGGDGVLPQMRIVVDTRLPEFALEGSLDGEKAVVIRYEAKDANLLSDSMILEVRVPGDRAANSDWQPLSIGPPDVSQPDRLVGRVRWSAPFDAKEVEVRGSIADRAGHRQQASTTVALSGPALTMPGDRSQQLARIDDGPMLRKPSREPERTQYGTTDPFLSGNSAQVADRQTTDHRASQEWPANNQLPRQEFGDSSNPMVGSRFARQPPIENPYMDSGENTLSRRTPARFAVDGQQDAGADSLQSLPRAGPPSNSGSSSADGWSSSAVQTGGDQMRMVNSRTFEIEYDLDSVGPWGVAKVELWGTTDGGATWQSYGVDPDNRSPFRVTVPGAGVYGFRIVVDGANGAASPRPRGGERPELFVMVDLQPPTAELISVESGQGNLVDHLTIRWRAEDTNLERRPVSLFYSTFPSGPWSTIATGLENTGSYVWRIERHVPDRFYVRLEVRDTAGNLAAVQTEAPVSLDRPQPTGTLRNVRPVASPPGT